MSESSFVIPPTGNKVRTGDPQIATGHNAFRERNNPTVEEQGPFKQILAQQDSLYRYISWENPGHTLALYASALSVLFAVHYLPLTQYALKGGMVTLGVVSVTELVTKSVSSQSMGSRLRPREYKTFPESTLNATLKDVHDFAQYAVVQAQKIVYGQDLEKTFAAFIGVTALYFLIQIVPAFWLTVMGLTSVFIAPLAFSPRGRQAARDASVAAQDMASATVDKTKELAQSGQTKASELSSQAQQTASNLAAQAKGAVSNTSERTSEITKNLPQPGTNSTSTGTNFSDNSANSSNSGLHSTSAGMNTTGRDPGHVNLESFSANGFNGTSSFNTTDSSFDTHQLATDKASTRMPQFSNTMNEPTRHVAPESNVLHRTAPPVPAKMGSKRTDSVAGAGLDYVPVNQGNF